MTHDELLFKIYEIHNNNSDAGQEATKQYKGMIQFMQALRAVVGLHRPISFPSTSGLPLECTACRAEPYYSTNKAYPCPTIQAIEKELV